MRPLPNVPALLLAAAAASQQEATTLAVLAARADVVAVATAVAASDPSPAFHRIEFRTEAALRGAPGQEFAVLEPAGRCCGRALFALQPGDRSLLFLQRSGAGLQPLGGDRGVLAAVPEVVDHVRALLAAADDAALARALAAGLDRQDPRVRADAALELAGRPASGLDPLLADAAARALARELDAGSALVPALITVVVRHGGAAAAPPLLAACLAAARPDQARALQQGLLRLPTAALHDALALQPPGTADAQVRACELLGATNTAASVPSLQRLLQAALAPRAALAAAEALLACGEPAAALAGLLPAPVFELALRRRAALPALRTLPARSRP